jgi:PTH1 family peptidyl-tRNA hydrolase
VKLIVGLGNPGAQYLLNRHNVGFMCVDVLANDYHFRPYQSKFRGLFAEGDIKGQKVYLLKPMTYMNLSGSSVAEACRFYKIPLEDMIVIQDDIDLPCGKIRIKKDSGHGGHNGIKSLEQYLGKGFWRLKIGVGRPSHPGQDTASFVLENFKNEDEKWLIPLLQEISYFADLLVQGEYEKFVSQVLNILSKEK